MRLREFQMQGSRIQSRYTSKIKVKDFAKVAVNYFCKTLHVRC